MSWPANFTDAGGPAFPVVIEPNGSRTIPSYGMSLRDWFAGRAMVPLLAKRCKEVDTYVALEVKDDGPDEYSDADCIAEQAYLMADAMLAAREAKS